MNTETLDLRIQNIKAAIERETEDLTADELKMVRATVAIVPSLSKDYDQGLLDSLGIIQKHRSRWLLSASYDQVEAMVKTIVALIGSTPPTPPSSLFPETIPTTYARTDGSLPSSSLARRIAEKIYDEVVDLFAMPADEARATDNFAAIVESELAAIPIETGWRDMATIPRDGSDVLLLRLAKTASYPVWIGRADSNPTTDYVWLAATGEAPFSDFDGWQPRPPLPSQPESRKS